MVCLQPLLSLCSLLPLSSACGCNGFDTRVLMNLISLMCLCSLSPKSLLLFNGVLQSYLISPLVVSQHAGNADSQYHDVLCNMWKTEGTLCLTDLCYRAENRPWQKYSERRYYCFFHLKFSPWLSLSLHIDPFLQPFHSKCFSLISTAPTSPVSYSNQWGWLPIWQLTPSIN